MNVEVLIYIYLAVCLAMIGFNVVCIFAFRHSDRRLERHSANLEDEVRLQVGRPEPDPIHLRQMRRYLRRTGNLMALDRTLEALRSRRPDDVARYVRDLEPIFAELVGVYMAKDRLKTAYLPYVFAKYRMFAGCGGDPAKPSGISSAQRAALTESMMELVADANLYCRENALHALYGMGSVKDVVRALRVVDRCGFYHHDKLITDGLLTFSGNHDLLRTALLERIDQFSVGMQVAVLNYIRFSSGACCAQMLELLLKPDQDDEVRYCCLRYFGRYPYEPAYGYLLDCLERESVQRWEYAAIAATSLAGYPGDRTVAVLRAKLGSRAWHVRHNAAQSLEALGLDYPALVGVFEGRDRYASEIMRYRLDHRRMREQTEGSGADERL